MKKNIPETKFAQSNGLVLAYDSFGDPSAEPLLLVMGLGMQMTCWEEDFCRSLVARGYYVIRFDNRDIGLSTHLSQAGLPDIKALMMRALIGLDIAPASVPYTLTDMAVDTVGLVGALGIHRAHMVGASMGGAIAQEIALRYPERVRTLVSIMATSGAPGLPPPRAAAMSVLMSPAPRDRKGYIERYQQIMRVLRDGRFPEEERHDPERAGRAFDRGINPAGSTRQLAAVLASGSRKARLASLKTPTLVIHGERDPLIPIECGKDVADTVPGARMVAIRNMGHALPRAAWPQIADAIAAHTI